MVCCCTLVFMHRKIALSLLLLITGGAQVTFAEEPADSLEAAEPVEAADPAESEASPEYVVPRLSAQYFWDEGALPFVYGSAAVAVSWRFSVDPRETPLLFPQSEGGSPVKGDTIPSYVVGIYAAAGAGVLGLTPTPARLHHFKGYTQAVLTTLALTEIAKTTFARHRPDYSEGDTDIEQSQSFFSGHASITAVTSLYLGLYFHQHTSKLVGGDAAFAKTLVYVSLVGVAVGIPLTRLNDNRHHLSDVLTGSAVGGALAAAFFAYHEARFERDRAGEGQKEGGRLVVLPDIENRGLTLATRW